MSLDKCDIITFPRIDDPRGSLSFLEGNQHIPFEIKRLYYLYKIKSGHNRGSHAHKKCQQFLIPICGSFSVSLDDSKNKKTFFLSEPNIGLYISPMIWNDLYDFSEDAICLVAASDNYSEEDYFRNYEDFCNIARGTL